MRRALGLQGGSRPVVHQQRADQARPRHKFVQDGGVPVVMMNRSADSDPTAPFRARLVEAEAAIEAERTAHAITRRHLQETQAQAQALQTRLAHAELAHADALAAERRLRAQAEEPRNASPAPVRQVRKPRPPAKVRVTSQRPVKWWLPGFKDQ